MANFEVSKTHTEQDVYDAIGRVIKSINYKIPITSMGVLSLQMLTEQELAKEDKFLNFRLIISDNRDIKVVLGDPNYLVWEDFVNFQKDGKNYIMFPDPYQE